MRRQLGEAGGGAVSNVPQLGERVLQLAEHVEPTHTGGTHFRVMRKKPKLLQKLKVRPDDVLVSPLVGPTLVAGGGQRDHLLFPHQLQPLVETLCILLLRRQQQLAEPHAPGARLLVWRGRVVIGRLNKCN